MGTPLLSFIHQCHPTALKHFQLNTPDLFLLDRHKKLFTSPFHHENLLMVAGRTCDIDEGVEGKRDANQIIDELM